MNGRRIRVLRFIRPVLAALALAAMGGLAVRILFFPSGSPAAGEAAGGWSEAAGFPRVKPGLPEERHFERMAENDAFLLLADRTTAHFRLVDKRSGITWRSYPDPAHWEAEGVSETWKRHLASPILFDYVDADHYKSLPVTGSLMASGGVLEHFARTDRGFAVTFSFPELGLKIPAEVSLYGRYVETRIHDEGIAEEGPNLLLNVKLYPLFGAEPSLGQEGYLFIPDGSGALIRFEQDRAMPQLVYNESVYGNDLSFFHEQTNRQRVLMPVYGLKSGDRAFVAIITEGEAYAHVFAAPSGAVGRFNWVTAEWQYRKRFFQSVGRHTGEGFYAYGREPFAASGRATRYYPLLPGESDYAGMAAVYRTYLMEELGVRPQVPEPGDVPLFVDVLGADNEKGWFGDRYLKVTTWEEAGRIIRAIREAGAGRIRVNAIGWQQGGYSDYGGHFPADARLGGSRGLKAFIADAHALGIPVFLGADYTLNANGKDGFWWRRDGLRNPAGAVPEKRDDRDREPARYVSALFYRETLLSDLPDYEALGADGIYFENGIGQQASTDYNPRYRSTREEAIAVQVELLRRTKARLGSAVGHNPNFYAVPQLDHVHLLADGHSHDVFAAEEVPFAQIVLHGLRTYTLGYSNARDEWRDGFLRSIEYGAYPAYLLGAASADDLRRSYGDWPPGLDYRNWLETIRREVREAAEALGDVTDRFITGHHTPAPGVKVTEYGDARRIIVNYNPTDVQLDGRVIPAKDFVVVKGGE